MDEDTLIVIALAVCLALIASLYFRIDRLGDRVLTLATQARGREQNDIINHERLPPIERRAPEDGARVAIPWVLQEISHIVDQFRRAVERGQPCRLIVSERGRRIGRVVIEIAIEGRRR